MRRFARAKATGKGPLEWLGENEFRVGDTSYVCHLNWVEEIALRPRQLAIVKPRAMIERYVDLILASRPKNIVEIGIYKGGSTALLAQLAEPDKLVAIDVRDQPVRELEDFIDRHGMRDTIDLEYGVHQADVERVAAIVDRELGGAELDLVVDDASHRLAGTRQTFHCLFPRLRPGGVYVIEDWSWAHVHASVLIVPGPSLAALVFELTLACAYAPGLVESVTVFDDSAIVRRGASPIGDEPFDISDCMDDLGREMVAAVSFDLARGAEA